MEAGHSRPNTYGHPVTVAQEHFASTMPGSALNLSPDGRRLLAAKNDGETVAWNIPILRAELAKLGLDWEEPQK